MFKGENTKIESGRMGLENMSPLTGYACCENLSVDLAQLAELQHLNKSCRSYFFVEYQYFDMILTLDRSSQPWSIDNNCWATLRDTNIVPF